MKLLFDQNLSFRLCQALADLFPGSSQVRLLGLAEADDRVLWEHAKSTAFVLVTQDSDFADMTVLYGQPPKVIWLRCGNQPTPPSKNSSATTTRPSPPLSRTPPPRAWKSCDHCSARQGSI